MRKILALSILPLLGLVFIATALFWNKRELRLRFLGEEAEGRIVGMVLQRAGSADLLTGLDTTLVLELANGDRLTATYRNYAPVAGSYQSASAPSPRAIRVADLVPGTPGTDPALTPALSQVLENVLRGDAAIIRWALLREARRTTDVRRVLRVEKTEHVRGYFGVPVIPEVMGMKEGELLLAADGRPSATEGTASIRAVFDRRDVAADSSRKGESLVSYEYRRNGEAVEPAKRDFFLSAEPYTTEFRPAFAFDVDGATVARLSHIGRHGGPTLALRLYTGCKVYFDPRNPAEAIVIADPGPIGGMWLNWFSRACEGLFSQWGSGALIVFAGTLFIGVGFAVISLVLWPSRHLPTDAPPSHP